MPWKKMNRMSKQKIMIRAFLATFLTVFIFPNLASAKEIVVTQKDKQFSTQAVEAEVGDVLVFKNEDTVAHNVFSSTAGQEFNVKIQKPGTEAKTGVKAAGTFEARCAIHPKMVIKVTVKNK